MTHFGPVTALVVLAAVALAGLMIARHLWPQHDPEVISHHHDNLPLDHPHLHGTRDHAHPYVVDEHHPRWASQL
jgi:hypothetical protein